MITCNLMGGLGNLMFQIAATYAVALENNDECYFDLDLHSRSIRPQQPANAYKNNIFSRVKDMPRQAISMRYNAPDTPEVNPNFYYTKIPYAPNMLIHGYLQSEKYFINYEKQVRELFKETEQITDYLNKLNLKFEDFVSLHVRRGDYVRLPLIYPPQTIEYYRNALEITEKKNVLVFSDDIAWCKTQFSGLPYSFFYVENNIPDFLSVYLMSRCQNNIIANSSFSWWGAWLNINNKKVIIPKNWFGPAINITVNDLCCKGWILL